MVRKAHLRVGYLLPVRIWVLALAAAAASPAHADRIITVPTARKLPFRTVRYELQAHPGGNRVSESYLGIGIGTALEIELRHGAARSGGAEGTIDFAYNYLPPILDAPGISFGIQDALDRTPDGQRFFFAIGFRPMFSTLSGDVPADVTLGAFLGRVDSAFVGVAIPFSEQVRLLAEHNGYRLSSGFEIRPVRTIGLRAILRDQALHLGFWATKRF